MNELSINPGQFNWTKEFFLKYKPHWKNRYFSNYRATFEGFLAEVIICDLMYLPRPEVKLNDKDAGYDVIWQGLKFDVKNTTVNKNEVYVATRQLNKNTDGFIFTRTELNLDDNENFISGKLFLLGYVYSSEIETKGEYLQKGELTLNNVKVKTDDYVLQIHDLTPLNNYTLCT